jgi:hypothetical protein
MDSNGRLFPALNSTWDPMPSAAMIQGAAGVHPINAYMKASEIQYQESCPSANSTLLAGSQALRNIPAAQDGNWNVDVRDYIDIPWQNTYAFQQPPPGPLTSANLDLLSETGGSTLSLAGGNGLLRPITEDSGVTCKITFFYNIGPLQGVSESWYSNGTTSASVTLNQIGGYLNTRMGISGTSTFFTYCRISTLTPPATNRRLVQIYYPADLQAGQRVQILTQGDYSIPNADPGSNDPWSAMLTRRINGNQFSLGYVRGTPDGIDTSGGQFVVPTPATYTTAFTLWANYVIGQNWGWLASLPTSDSPASLASATANADGTATLTFTPKAGGSLGLFGSLPVNTRVQLRISQQLLPAGINGVYTVVVVSPTVCKSLRPLNVATFVAGNGVGTIYAKTLVPTTSMRIEKMVSRRSGARFGRSRGRRKNRVNG